MQISGRVCITIDKNIIFNKLFLFYRVLPQLSFESTKRKESVDQGESSHEYLAPDQSVDRTKRRLNSM